MDTSGVFQKSETQHFIFLANSMCKNRPSYIRGSLNGGLGEWWVRQWGVLSHPTPPHPTPARFEWARFEWARFECRKWKCRCNLPPAGGKLHLPHFPMNGQGLNGQVLANGQVHKLGRPPDPRPWVGWDGVGVGVCLGTLAKDESLWQDIPRNR